MAEIVSLTLAVPPVLEQVVRLGKNLAMRIQATRNNYALLGDLSLFTDHSGRTLATFKVGKQICNDTTVDMEIRSSLEKDFDNIQKTILDALDHLERLEKSSKLYKFWVADKPRRAVEEATHRLGRLARRFQDTVQLVYISGSLPSSVLLQADAFQLTPFKESVKVAEEILLCHGHLTQTFQTISPKVGQFLCERKSYAEATRPLMERDIRSLSELLSSAPLSESFFKLVGYRDLPEIHQFELVFDFPEDLTYVDTLSTFILKTEILSLNSRIALCRQIADAVLDVHRLKLVHKNINSTNIMMVLDGPDTSGSKVWRPILFNWHFVRKLSAATQFLGEPKWWGGIYQHPTRQMVLADKEYTMAHDIYSLGVLILEILLWCPLVVHVGEAAPTISKLFKEEVFSLGIISEQEWTQENLPSPEGEPFIKPQDVQRIILSIAAKRIPAAAGAHLTQLVCSCLAVLENGFDSGNIVGKDHLSTGLNFSAAVKGALEQVWI